MSGVFISGGAKAPIQTAQYARNGKVPSAEFQAKLAELIGFNAVYLPKVIYTRAAPIGAIPTSEAGSRARWAFMFRTSAYCKTLAVQMIMAPQNAGSPASPYGKLTIKEATITAGVVTAETTVAEARVNWGSSDGTYTDVPRNFGGGIVTLYEPGTNTPVDLDPNTDYTAYLTDEDYARVFALTVWEVIVDPDTDNGFARTGTAADSPIYDVDRSAAAIMLRNLWETAAQHLWNGGAETDDDIVETGPPVSLTLDLLAYDSPGTLKTGWLLAPEVGLDIGYEIEIDAVGAHTDVEIVFTLPLVGSTAAGIDLNNSLVNIDAAIESANTGWAAALNDNSGAGPLTITLTKASLAEGTHVLDLTVIGMALEPHPFAWAWGTSSSPGGGTVYAGPVTVSVTGSSNEVTATGWSDTGVAPSDVYGVIAFSPDPATEDEEVEFTASVYQYGSTGGIIQMVIQISDAVTCSEPTTVTNADGWTIGSWSSPGGGVQWQATATKTAPTIPSSIVLATTPSAAGTLAVTTVITNLTTGFADTTTETVTVDAASSAMPTFEGIGTPAGGSSDVTPTNPTHAANDILVLMCETQGADSVSAPSGWTLLTTVTDSFGSGTKLTVFWLRASGSSEPDPTVTDPGDHCYAVVACIRGCTTSGSPYDVTGSGTAGALSTSFSIPGATTTVNNCLVLAIVSNSAGGTGPFTSGWTNADLSSLTEQQDAGTGAGNGGGISFATGGKATAGAYGATTGTITSSVQARLSIAFKP